MALSTLLLAGCGGREETADATDEGEEALTEVTLQLDWYAESAHGGFYQAVLEGYYREAGLKVDIVQGGPGTQPLQSVSVGRAHFTLGRIDDVITAIDRGLPVTAVMAYMQRDPQAIMFHASNPISDWQDLDGKSLMVEPGSAFVSWLAMRYEIEFDIMPLDYGLQRFLADKDFIQQCFITSQPFHAEQQGAQVKTLLLSDSGYNPERVVMTSRSLLRNKPEIVEAFIVASARGWEDYMDGDASGTHGLLLEINQSNTAALNEYSRQAMRDNSIVRGRLAEGQSLATIDPQKLEETIVTLHELGMIETPVDPRKVVDYERLPEAVSGAVERSDDS